MTTSVGGVDGADGGSTDSTSSAGFDEHCEGCSDEESGENNKLMEALKDFVEMLIKSGLLEAMGEGSGEEETSSSTATA